MLGSFKTQNDDTIKEKKKDIVLIEGRKENQIEIKSKKDLKEEKPDENRVKSKTELLLERVNDLNC